MKLFVSKSQKIFKPLLISDRDKEISALFETLEHTIVDAIEVSHFKDTLQFKLDKINKKYSVDLRVKILVDANPKIADCKVVFRLSNSFLCLYLEELIDQTWKELLK